MVSLRLQNQGFQSSNAFHPLVFVQFPDSHTKNDEMGWISHSEKRLGLLPPPFPVCVFASCSLSKNSRPRTLTCSCFSSICCSLSRLQSLFLRLGFWGLISTTTPLVSSLFFVGVILMW